MYALMLGTLTIIEIIVSLNELRANLFKIRQMILFETSVRVLRFGKSIEVSSRSLVPGDLVFINSMDKISCDCVLI